MVKVKCPNCGKLLSVKEVPDLDKKIVRCSICGERRLFSEYRKVEEQASQSSDDTEINYPKGKAKGSDDTYVVDSDVTLLNNSAYLVDMQTKKEYALKDGKNFVGRKANSTPAKVNVRIETTDRGFSRAHLGIEVIKMPDNVRKYKICNDDNKHFTFVNGDKLEKEDILFLKNNDIIKSSTVELQFLLK